MGERTKAVLATIALAVACALIVAWCATISAWGPAVYSVALAAVVVWLLWSAERHPYPGTIDEERVLRRPETPEL